MRLSVSGVSRVLRSVVKVPAGDSLTLERALGDSPDCNCAAGLRCTSRDRGGVQDEVPRHFQNVDGTVRPAVRTPGDHRSGWAARRCHPGHGGHVRIPGLGGEVHCDLVDLRGQLRPQVAVGLPGAARAELPPAALTPAPVSLPMPAPITMSSANTHSVTVLTANIVAPGPPVLTLRRLAHPRNRVLAVRERRVSNPPRRVPDLAHRLMNRPAQARAVQIAA
jgi:hypothetical protein